jgi:hypothetical protein
MKLSSKVKTMSEKNKRTSERSIVLKRLQSMTRERKEDYPAFALPI